MIKVNKKLVFEMAFKKLSKYNLKILQTPNR